MAELRLQKVDGKERFRVDRKMILGRHPDNDIRHLSKIFLAMTGFS